MTFLRRTFSFVSNKPFSTNLSTRIKLTWFYPDFFNCDPDFSKLPNLFKLWHRFFMQSVRNVWSKIIKKNMDQSEKFGHNWKSSRVTLNKSRYLDTNKNVTIKKVWSEIKVGSLLTKTGTDIKKVGSLWKKKPTSLLIRSAGWHFRPKIEQFSRSEQPY